MSTPNCRIVTNFQRPSREMVDLFADIPSSNIGDVMNRMACMAPRIRPFNNCPLLGPAFTVKAKAGDILFLHKATMLARPGDVLVVDGQGSLDAALTGELMTTFCRKKGIAGIVIDGSVRDVGALRSYTDFAVYAAGVTPTGPLKIGGGEIGTPVTCGNIVVRPGDILAGDEDGVVVIPQESAREIAKLAKANMEREQGILDRLNADGTWDRPWVDEMLRSIGCAGLDG